MVPESVILLALNSNIKLGREEDIPAENQRGPMAGDVIAYLFPGVRVETQNLVNQLLEIRIVSRGRTAKPAPTKHSIQLIEWDGASEDFGHI